MPKKQSKQEKAASKIAKAVRKALRKGVDEACVEQAVERGMKQVSRRKSLPTKKGPVSVKPSEGVASSKNQRALKRLTKEA